MESRAWRGAAWPGDTPGMVIAANAAIVVPPPDRCLTAWGFSGLLRASHSREPEAAVARRFTNGRSEEPPGQPRSEEEDPQGRRARVPLDGPQGEDRGRPHEALRDGARPLPRVHTGRRRALPRDRAGPGALVRLHGPRQPRGGRLERHRRPRPRRHRPRRRQAGDGGQGRPLQALRGHRRLRHQHRREGDRQGLHGGEGARADLRGHQPRGHQGPRVLHHRGAAQEGDADPGLPRRSARDRDHLRGGAPQRARARRAPQPSPARSSTWRSASGERTS